VSEHDRPPVLERVTSRALKYPRRVLAAAVVIIALCAALGSGIGPTLLAGGYSDPASESARATAMLNNIFNRGGPQVILRLRLPAGGDIASDAAASTVAETITSELESKPFVQRPVLSLWRNPDLAPALRSDDRTSGLIVVTVTGGDRDGPANAQQIDQHYTGERAGIDVTVGGEALVYHQVTEQTARDLTVAEAIAIPVTFVMLVWVFGGLIAAAIPIVIGLVAIAGAAAILRLLTAVTDVSVFALNLATALGLALAIDYTLLIVSRYREESANGVPRADAVVRTMSTAGRTVLFSSVTVALSLSAMAIFPMYFLRSFAYAGVGVIVVAASAALVITPAILFLLGNRIDALDVRNPIRKVLRRPPPRLIAPQNSAFYRSTRFVFHHYALVGLAVVAFLLVLGAPFLGIKVGYPDDRVLPASASSHQLGDQLRDDFSQNASVSVTSVLPGVGDDAEANSTVDDYAARLSRVDGVDSVVTARTAVVDGRQVAAGDPGASVGGSQFVTVATSADPLSDTGQTQLDTLRAVSPPPGTDALFTGLAQQNRDNVNAIVDRLPLVFGVIVIATFVLLFLLSGSLVMPLKALVLNAISLSATFGAMVWIFQDGHLGGLGTTVTGSLAATMPVLMFCIAFGLSMDYEVFVLSRIREEWLRTGGNTRTDNEYAVAMGLARTGRVVTAAAVLMAVVFAAIVASQVAFMRMFGLGLMLAVLVDATLVRVLLVPAFMRFAGTANWWAPVPVRRLHDRIGITE
jgi:RND superfamily putative drug exporter